MNMNKLIAGAGLLALVAFGAIADTFTATPEPDVVMTLEAQSGGAPEVVVMTTPVPVVQPNAVYALINEGDRVRVRWLQVSDGWIIPSEQIEAMCRQNQSLRLSGLPVTDQIMRVSDGRLYVGETSVEFSCPLPAGYERLGEVWADREAEHAMVNEFTAAHLREMISVIERDDPVLITPQRLRGHGGDRPIIEASLERNWGQFMAHVLEIDGIIYMVPLMTDLSVCGGQCAFPRLVVLHTHLVQQQPRAPRVYTPPRVSHPQPPNLGELPTIRCVDPCR